MTKPTLSCVLLVVLAALAVTARAARPVGLKHVEASTLTLCGQLMPGNPNPYHRVDTVRFKGFTRAENLQVRESAGLAVAFKTDSRVINVRTVYGQYQSPVNTTGIAARGYDLYVRRDGTWRYAGSGCKSDQRLLLGEDLELVANMDGSMHECLLYLPLFAEVDSVQIAVEASARIEPLPRPFRHRSGVWGSSFTHGTGVSRAGMTYVAQLSRLTGLEMLSLGCSGHSKLQPYFARVLAAAQVDAFLFDCFSNPSPGEIRERLLPFIETVRQALPGIPLVFQRTIRREGRNFNLKADSLEAAKIAVADSMMALACRRYSDVYYITPSATPPDHLSSVDGVHPDDYGYTLWARSLRGQLLPILKKYGIE